MKKRDIEIRLKQEAKAVTPDIYEKVASAPINTDNIIAFNKGRSNIRRKTVRNTLAAACAALVVGVGALFYSMNVVTDSSISIDVNPSIEIVTNKRDKVIKVNALNADAKTVLGTMELENTSIEVTVNAIIGSMVKSGYISANKRDILVTVENKDEQKAKTIRDRVDRDIADTLGELEIKPNIVSQTSGIHEKGDDVEKQAEQNGISYGKALMISRLREKYPSLSSEKLESMTTSEIVSLLKSQEIKDYDDIFEVDDENEPYCDDCGKLKTECRKGECADNGDYCEHCGEKEDTCNHDDIDDDDKDVIISSGSTNKGQSESSKPTRVNIDDDDDRDDDDNDDDEEDDDDNDENDDEDDDDDD